MKTETKDVIYRINLFKDDKTTTSSSLIKGFSPRTLYLLTDFLIYTIIQFNSCL